VHRATLTGYLQRGLAPTDGRRAEPRAEGNVRGALYDTYCCADGRPFLLATLEPKFWANFCRGVGREDLIEQWAGAGQLGFGGVDDLALRRELEDIFATAPAAEWQERFMAWDVPGGEVLAPDELLDMEHFRARALRQEADDGAEYVATAIRWHHADERAGANLGAAPAVGEHRDAILRDWLGR
jgi:crotonobetainyl-CoA:carnitine CoA-transferase CaiB-like acyl-CoA transferase